MAVDLRREGGGRRTRNGGEGRDREVEKVLSKHLFTRLLMGKQRNGRRRD